jgi:hypothetical protein
MKKIGSLALAGVMAFSLAIPAFASDDSGEKKEDESSSSTTETTETTGTNTTTEIETTYQEIPIAVTVPTTGAAQINPYGLPVEVKDGDDVIAEITGQQITTAPLYITNNGNIALSVGATVTAETKGSVNLVTSAIVTSGKSANTGKDIYAYLQMAKVADVKDVVVTDAATDLTTPVATVCADSTAWSSTNNLVLNPDEEVSKSGIITLGVQGEKTNDDKTISSTYGESVVAFRLAGSCVTAPADDEWNEEDGFTATIAFTFTPAES